MPSWSAADVVIRLGFFLEEIFDNNVKNVHLGAKERDAELESLNVALVAIISLKLLPYFLEFAKFQHHVG